MDEAWEPMKRDCRGGSRRGRARVVLVGGRRMQTNGETSDAVKRRSTGTIDVTRRRRCRNGRVDERMGSVVTCRPSVSGRYPAVPQIALIGLANGV
jgi:hypothetical protein